MNSTCLSRLSRQNLTINNFLFHNPQNFKTPKHIFLHLLTFLAFPQHIPIFATSYRIFSSLLCIVSRLRHRSLSTTIPLGIHIHPSTDKRRASLYPAQDSEQRTEYTGRREGGVYELPRMTFIARLSPCLPPSVALVRLDVSRQTAI